ncbi:ATP-dependent protease La domain-containing protein [Pilaira anomala]|nr:ATP-dependent protease La domain-containing protein [Pilaira anomala]
MINSHQHIDNSKNQNVGRAVIHQYKSPYKLESSVNTTTDTTLNTLTHCQKCNNRFNQPITLTCGFTLCHSCLPPPTSQCLSFSCLRTHSNENLKPTILLENILSQSSALKDLLDCSICLSTLVEPITTQCGHTFCKDCLIRTMTNLNTRSCPFCRTKLNRIGKVNQIISGWIDYMNHNTIKEQIHQQHIPIIQVTSAIAFPTQHCLIHITNDKLNLLDYMISHPNQKHYAICIFSKSSCNEFFDYGMMLQIRGIESSPDLRHSVIQASGLFRLRINQLTVDSDGCYTGDVTRLDDQQKNIELIQLVVEEPPPVVVIHQNKKLSSNHVITTQSTPATPNIIRKVIRPRPCSMRLSSSVPNSSPYSVQGSFPGSANRKAWANGMNYTKPPSPPPPPVPSSSASSPPPPPLSPTTNSILSRLNLNLSNESLFHTELHSFLTQYLSNMDYPVWSMQYEWYLQQPNGLDSVIWWSANILPLTYNEKIMLLGMNSLRERLITLIVWAENSRSC